MYVVFPVNACWLALIGPCPTVRSDLGFPLDLGLGLGLDLGLGLGLDLPSRYLCFLPQTQPHPDLFSSDPSLLPGPRPRLRPRYHFHVWMQLASTYLGVAAAAAADKSKMVHYSHFRTTPFRWLSVPARMANSSSSIADIDSEHELHARSTWHDG